MKGSLGIFTAVSLGLVAMLANWWYLHEKAAGYDPEQFVGVRGEPPLKRGELIKEDHLIAISVPKDYVGNLEQVAVPWLDRMSYVGTTAVRSYGTNGPELLLRKDLRTPARQDLNAQINVDERVIWIPIDSRAFSPQLVNPGNLVSFRVPAIPGGANGGSQAPARTAATSTETLGPFRILALGDRRGRRDIHQAAGLSTRAENVIAIAVKVEGGQLEPKARRLSDILQLTNFQGVQVQLHSRDTSDPSS